MQYAAMTKDECNAADGRFPTASYIRFKAWGESVSEPLLKEEGKKVLDKILSIWPAIMHKGRREKILYILSMIMASKGIAEAGPDEVIEAVKVIVPKSFLGLPVNRGAHSGKKYVSFFIYITREERQRRIKK